jgi:predicted Zn-ribbon and HTH transcriptional regulator
MLKHNLPDDSWPTRGSRRVPSLYQGVCRNCSHRTAIMTAGYGAVLVDRPLDRSQTEVAGACLLSAAAGKLAESADPRFVVLAHPLESKILADTGYTWNDLYRQGRYVLVTNVVCRRCGAVFQKRELGAPGEPGWVVAILIGLLSGTAAGLWAHRLLVGVLVFCGLGGATGALAGWIARWRVRRRFRARAAALAAESTCPACGADDAAPISRVRSVRCPACRQQSQRFIHAGTS